MPKDLVGAKGSDINKRERVYIPLDTSNQISLTIKAAAYNAALRTALGWKDTPTANLRVHKETQMEAYGDWGCIPVTIEYIDEGLIGYAKTVAAPDADLKTIIGQKYHGTLDIVSYKVGH